MFQPPFFISSRQLLAIVVGSLLVCLLVSPSLAQLPAIELHGLSQPVAQIGSTIVLQINGSSIEELSQLHVSSSHVTVQTNLEAAQLLGDPPLGNGTFQTLIDSAATPGRCEVRAVGRHGVSNPRPLWLTRRPVKVANDDHSQSATAMEIMPGSIVVARCTAQRRNYYRLAMEAGQTLGASVYAHQLDSRATPILVLYGPAPERRELGRSRAVGNWPAELSIAMEHSGEVLLAVYDAIYAGGPDYSYALECSIYSGSSPDASTTSELELDGLLRPNLQTQSQNIYDLERWGLPQVEKRDETLKSADELRGDESVPFRVAGILGDGEQPCVHCFSANKDQQLWIDVESQRTGRLTDPRLVLYRVTTTAREDGEPQTPTETLQPLLEFDDPVVLGDASLRVAVRDPLLEWTVPEDGHYRLELLDNESGSRKPEQRSYQLSVAPRVPSFELLVFPPYPINNSALSRPVGANVMRGGTTSLRVLAARRGGFDAAIEIEAVGLPEGVSCTPVVLHPSQSECSLTLQCDEMAAAWTGPIQITGNAANDETRLATAQPASLVWPAIASRNVVQSQLCDAIVLSVNPLDTAAIAVQLGDGQTLEVEQGAKLSIPVSVNRRAGGATPCVLRAQNLLSKTTLAEVTVAADQTQAAVEVAVAEDAPLGEFAFWLQCETKVKWRDNPQALERAEAHLQRLQDALTSATDDSQKQSLQSSVENVTARVTALKQSTAEKELTVWLPSTTQLVRVVAK